MVKKDLTEKAEHIIVCLLLITILLVLLIATVCLFFTIAIYRIFLGCPFKHCDSELLSQRLELMGLNKTQIAEVNSEVKMKRYDRACARTFEVQHKMEPGALGTVISHPNQYFTMSREIYEGKRSTTVLQTKEIELKVKKEEADDFDENMEF